MQQEWTDQQYVERAQQEPERLKFWLQYYSHLEACKATCDNSPWVDRMFRQSFPTTESFNKFKEELDAERI